MKTTADVEYWHGEGLFAYFEVMSLCHRQHPFYICATHCSNASSLSNFFEMPLRPLGPTCGEQVVEQTLGPREERKQDSSSSSGQSLGRRARLARLRL